MIPDGYSKSLREKIDFRVVGNTCLEKTAGCLLGALAWRFGLALWLRLLLVLFWYLGELEIVTGDNAVGRAY